MTKKQLRENMELLAMGGVTTLMSGLGYSTANKVLTANNALMVAAVLAAFGGLFVKIIINRLVDDKSDPDRYVNGTSLFLIFLYFIFLLILIAFYFQTNELNNVLQIIERPSAVFLSDNSIESLRKKEILIEILKKVEPLKNKKFSNDHDFFSQLEKILSHDEYREYVYLIGEELVEDREPVFTDHDSDKPFFSVEMINISLKVCYFVIGLLAIDLITSEIRKLMKRRK